MYTKFINDRQVFSDCKVIQTNDGLWISNPTEQQIIEAGWEIYTPPVIEEVVQQEPDYDQVVSAIKKLLSSELGTLSDEEALEVAALYPTWVSKIGQEVAMGERLWYNGKLWKVIQLHTVQEEWTPDIAVSLYTEVSIEEWPEWVQPTGVQDAYMAGDKVTFDGEHYISTMDNNVWSPTAYPAAWNKQ